METQILEQQELAETWDALVQAAEAHRQRVDQELRRLARTGRVTSAVKRLIIKKLDGR